VHSSNRGALLRLSEAICDLCRFSMRAKIRLAFAGAIARRYQIVGGGVSARHLKVSRHRDPAPVGVCHTVPAESSLLHCIGTDEFVERRHLPLPAGSCEQRRKHCYAALIPRMCQFFSHYSAANLSHESISGSIVIPAARQTSARIYLPHLGLARHIPVRSFP
jgi:hypothetical protein